MTCRVGEIALTESKACTAAGAILPTRGAQIGHVARGQNRRELCVTPKTVPAILPTLRVRYDGLVERFTLS